MLVIVIFSYIHHKGQNDEKGIEISKETFKTSPIFNVGAMAVMLVWWRFMPTSGNGAISIVFVLTFY